MRASFGSDHANLASEEQSILFGSRTPSVSSPEHTAWHPGHPVSCACAECRHLQDLTFRDW